MEKESILFSVLSLSHCLSFIFEMHDKTFIITHSEIYYSLSIVVPSLFRGVVRGMSWGPDNKELKDSDLINGFGALH